jgi:5-methylthioadenosine/S-adenosylhomocysteine deaminase
MADLLVKNIGTLIRDADRIETDVDMLVSDGNITMVGKDLEKTISDGSTAKPEQVDCRGKTVIPGFVNAHTHLYQCFLRGRTDTLALKPWNEEVIFPFANLVHALHWGKNDIEGGYFWSLVGCMEMIRSGITAFVNMDLTLDSSFQAYRDSGMRGVGAITAVNRWIPKELDRSLDVRKQEILGYIEKWHEREADTAMVRAFMAPSTPFACTPDFLNWQMEQAEKYNLGVQIHVSETSWEVEQSVRENGTTPLAYLDRIGFLRRPVLAVHCVHLTGEELELALEKDVTPVYNPKSNMKLGSGVAPVPEMIRKGLKPALATDGAASNDLLNMFEEMRCGAGLQKAFHRDATVLTAGDIFRMATENGARAVGINGGTLDPGKAADFVILSTDRIWSAPVHNPLQNLVYCGMPDNVESVYVAGKAVLKEGAFTTLDEKEIFQRAMTLFEEKFGSVRHGGTMAAEF